ncbi:MAG: D-alanyl-D-alanine carboxypeptidase [Oscillospiraceae bacterium]|jgi:D-alanyl-D-alanine carboxypeptidase (penicillin-binding protein 5/6)|nr:D-alanyl-D-alanine carboxypeptidase [Oscillospiraceae bacterium]
MMKKTKKRLLSLVLAAAALPAALGLRAGAAFETRVYLDDGGDLDITDMAQLASDAPVGDSAAALAMPVRAAILIEKETGTVIYEKDADAKREPASVTKIMTILLIVEALESGSLSLDDVVTTSAHAQSMGGSQIYLSEGERMSVHEMLKAIVVASANDAATAMAEHLAGSEPVFAERMNERAAQLGMTNTHFTNASGLLDDTTHVTTARDVSIMARELIGHDFIKQYTTIWTDSVRGGSFSLTNTNKLMHSYSGMTGLKTGFTSRAGHCLTATASRDGVEYIAVVLGGDTSDARFAAAKTLLDYAFANFALIDASPDEVLMPVRVELGKPKYVQPVVEGAGKLLVTREDAASVEKTVEISSLEQAPLAQGEQLGRFIIRSGERVIGEYAIVAGEDVSHVTWSDVFVELVSILFA